MDHSEPQRRVYLNYGGSMLIRQGKFLMIQGGEVCYPAYLQGVF